MRQYLIKEVSRKYIKAEDGKITGVEDTIKDITLGENDVFRMYAIWKGQELGKSIDAIIKVDLPADEMLAYQMLKNGTTIDGVKYISLITSVGMMKHEDLQEDYSCEYFFIKKEDKDFIDELGDIASLGKLKTKLGTSLCINKDIVARLSLLLSTGDRVHIPDIKVAVLPEAIYKYTSNYLEFKENENNEIDLDNLELVPQPNKTLEHTAMDGCGFAMPEVFGEIQNQINVRHTLDWALIRTLGTAGKGLLVSFDYKQYIKEELKTHKLVVKDMWGNDVDLMQVDVVLNATMVKWAKWFDSYEEIQERKNSPFYSKYKDLLNGFNITKYNQRTIKSTTEANYQIICNLLLTFKKLMELGKITEETYQEAINLDVDTCRMLLGDIVRPDQENLSASTKLHGLLQLNEGIANTKSFNNVIGNLIDKKIHQLAGGGIKLKGNYKTMCGDIISYINSLVEPQYIYDKDGKLKGIEVYMDKENGLQECYVANNIGSRVLARSPLNSATEMVKTELKPNELYDKYFGNLTEELLFVPFNDYMMRMSGADTDGDIAFVIDNETTYSSVIDDIDENGTRWYFHNQFDGKSVKDIYTKKNMYNRVLMGRGNKIGTLSNKGSKISNMIQELPYYSKKIGYFTLSGVYKTLENMYKDDVKGMNPKEKKAYLDKIKKEYKEKLDEKVESGEILSYKDIDDETIEKLQYNKWQELKKYSYYLTLLQMISIDSPKTAIQVDKKMLEPLNNVLKGVKKPNYIYHAKWTKANKTVDYKDCKWTNSILNNYSSYIISNYGDKAREIKEHDYNKNYLQSLLIKNNNIDYNVQLVDSLRDIANKYYSKRDSLEVNKEIKIVKEEQAKFSDSSDEYTILQDELSKLYKKRKEEYTLIDLIIHNDYNSFAKCYDYTEILRALYEVRTNNKTKYGKNCKINSRFIIEFAFEELRKHLIEQNLGIGTTYEKKYDGDITFFGEHYSKVNIDLDKTLNLTHKETIAKKKQLGQLTDTIKFSNKNGLTVTDELIIKEEVNGKWTNFNVYRLADDTLLGYVYTDYKDKVTNGQVIQVKDIVEDKNYVEVSY